MKKIISMCLMMVMLMSTVVTVNAASMKVIFTGSSNFKVGGKATVDFLKTSESVMNDGSIQADMYNAALEQNMTVTWKCSNGPNKSGKSVTWAEDDAGREYVCRVSFYNDSDCTDFVDYIDSQPFVVEADSAEPPEITTKSLPAATVGKYYSTKIKCTDPKASFGENYNPGKPNELSKTGLTLTSSGELKGKPAKAGTYTFTICAAGDNGEGYMTYKLTVKAAPVAETSSADTEKPTDSTEAPIDSSEAPADSTETPADSTSDIIEGTESVSISQPTNDQNQNNDNLKDILVYVAIGLGVLLVCATVIIIVLLTSKKKS